MNRFTGKLIALEELLLSEKNKLVDIIRHNNITDLQEDYRQLEINIYAIQGRIQQVKEFILEDDNTRQIDEAVNRLNAECPGLFGGGNVGL
jgi:hypothetical protein